MPDVASEGKLKKVAIVVINYNGKEHLRECFESLSQLSHPSEEYDVYMIDNNSSDGSVEFVNTNFSWVHVFSFDKNYGFAKGYNMAIDAIDSKYIALLNNDVRVSENWLCPLIRALDADEKRFAVGSKLLFYDTPDRINHAGAIVGFNGSGMDFGFLDKDSPMYNVEKETLATCGAAMLVRRSIWKRLGGFDESYFAYCEDSDLCWRAWIAGYTCLYVPESVALHKFGGTWKFEKGKSVPAKNAYIEKNKLISILKNYEVPTLFWVLPLTIAYDVIKIIMQFIRRKPSLGMAIAGNLFHAYAYVFQNMTTIIRKRKDVQQNRQVSDKKLIQKGFIYLPRQLLRRWKMRKRLILEASLYLPGHV